MTEDTKKKRKRAMTSSQVFSLFVKRLNGRETGEEILSEECFNLWVATRNKKLVHPEESFRRTLIAHIRGAYGRKPFTQEVEESLLNLLRETVRNGVIVNPWERCFPSNSLHIGKRGFNKAGYHEAKNNPELAMKKEEDSPFNSPAQAPLQMNPSTSIKVPPMHLDSLGVMEPSFPAVHLPQHSNWVQQPRQSTQIQHPILDDPLDHFQNSFDQQSLMIGEDIDAQKAVRLIYEISNFQGNNYGFLKKIADVLTQHFTFEELSLLSQEVKNAGFELLGAATQYFLRREHPLADLGIPLEYKIPNSETCSFDEERPCCKLLFNFKTWIVVDEDGETPKIFGRSIKGAHIFSLVESHVEFLYQLPFMFKCFDEGRTFFVRARYIKGNGTPSLFLASHQKRNADFSLVVFQDQGSEFPGFTSSRRLA